MELLSVCRVNYFLFFLVKVILVVNVRDRNVIGIDVDIDILHFVRVLAVPLDLQILRQHTLQDRQGLLSGLGPNAGA
jgi:hypothetical protein